MTQLQAKMKTSLKDVFISVCRFKHLSLQTERSYWSYIKRFYAFNHKRCLRELGVTEIREFLSHMAVKEKVSPTTQNTALCALRFLYREVYKIDLPFITEVVRAKQSSRLPAVFSRNEVKAILTRLTEAPRLVGNLLYGSGLRLGEALQLRIKDVDFEVNQIVVRAGKGQKDRRTLLPQSIRPLLQAQVERARTIYTIVGARNYPALSYRMLSQGSILKRAQNSAGSGFYQPQIFHVTHEVVSSAVTTFTMTGFSTQLKELSEKQESISMEVATHSDTAFQHTSWRQALIFALSKSC